MKANRPIILLVFFSLFFCKSPDQKHELINEMIKNLLCSNNTAESKKYVYIINATYYDGCHSCIEKVKEFCKNNNNHQDISIIISTKLKRHLKIEYNKDELQQACLDTNGIFASNTETIGTLPVVLMYEKGELVKHININPSNIDNSFIEITHWINDLN